MFILLDKHLSLQIFNIIYEYKVLLYKRVRSLMINVQQKKWIVVTTKSTFNKEGCF